jgi:hypothetical protein
MFNAHLWPKRKDKIRRDTEDGEGEERGSGGGKYDEEE